MIQQRCSRSGWSGLGAGWRDIAVPQAATLNLAMCHVDSLKSLGRAEYENLLSKQRLHLATQRLHLAPYRADMRHIAGYVA